MKRILGIVLLAASVSISAFASNAVPATPRQPNVSKLDPRAASRLAVELANQYASKHFDSAPFTASGGTLKFVRGRWEWEAMVGYGKGDLLAVVSFSPYGDAPKVEVNTLVSGSDVEVFGR